MTDIRWSERHPDESRLLVRFVRKTNGLYAVAAPAGATIIRAGCTATGGQGENPGGNASSARVKRKTFAGEVFQLQVGKTGSGGSAGDSWVKRAATGEMICYADRGRGTGGVQGKASFCIGDKAWDGVAGVGSGSDAAELARMHLGGRPCTSQIRAAGPGGGGWGIAAGTLDAPARYLAGQGLVFIEFYAGDPGVTF